ncbi:MAG: hypothetical protein ACE14P_11060 [Methanotrichaceae archaeon]
MPSNVSVVSGAFAEGNYSQGEDVIMSLMLNGSKVGLHLLYPCEIRKNLTLSGLRGSVNAFDPEMAQASYNSTPINISGLKALWGGLDNMTFAVYQPADTTVAIIFFNVGMPYRMKLDFLASLRIKLSDQLPERYCAPTKSELSSIEMVGRNSIFNNSTDKEFGPDMEAVLAGQQISQEALMNDQQFSRERADTIQQSLNSQL